MKPSQYLAEQKRRKLLKQTALPTIEHIYNDALGYHHAGNLIQAEQCYRKILAIDSRHADSLHLLGLIGFQSGHHAAAVEMMRKAIEINGNVPFYYNNLGTVLQAMGQSENAVAQYERAVSLKPDYAEAHMNLGNTLQKLDRIDEAIARYNRALTFNPEYAEAHMNLGHTLQDLGRIEEAIERYERALTLKPDYAEAHMNLGYAFHNLGRLEEAIARYEKAITLKPYYAEAHLNLGNALHDLGRLEETIVWYERALTLKPDYAEAHLNLGHSLQNLGRIEEAIERYERALALKPDYADAHLAKAFGLLLRGHFKAGWHSYEWRWRLKTFSSPKRNFAQSQWYGEPLNGRRVLLHGEQGFGDCLQFLRYVPMVQAAGGVVILEIPSGLKRICALLPGVTELIVFGEPVPDIDCHCPLMSLPLACGTDLNTIPAQVPYLSAPQEAREKARALTWPTLGLRVGLVWAGSAKHANDRFRSFPFTMFEPLLSLEGIHFFSLQMGKPAGQLSEAGAMVTDLAPEIADMADTAAQITHLDLVISVDTSVAHIAGALAKPFWLLLPHNADWRWLMSREDSPWYPTARLFRQSVRGDWKEVIDRVRVELSLLADAHLQRHP